MILKFFGTLMKSKNTLCLHCRVSAVQKCFYSQDLENKYTDEQKSKILRVMNDSSAETLSGFQIAKTRLKKLLQWRSSKGYIHSLSDVELIDGFSKTITQKLFDSIIDGPLKKIDNLSSKIKGQILHPQLTETMRQNCKLVASVFVAVNSVSWTLIDRRSYEVLDWQYNKIDYPEKRFQITDILEIAWKITEALPTADIYIMKAEATTLRAAGSDPSSPKVIAVNLQKAQIVAMIVALINARCRDSLHEKEEDNEKAADAVKSFDHNVYFLRPTLPYRLYGTLVGNEKVSTDQTVEMLLLDIITRCPNQSHVYICEKLKTMFRNQKELQKDMLGHCLLLGITFMDLCIYKNKERIHKLFKKRD